ncbi:DUF1465 family protein [Afifella marina]|uniref:Regulator of CtrA degradation n=1 Tax=Afifella marina DSM 2698 TaxID=1120955 RepID=A0A1G5P4G6_AFIMA|nr:DUF1465 family protein [Afifella marina]MBK1625099.1 DUF1465 domain-containing protein [Afifella marina DSM 2698]MBK1628803.1 DUF1465 domain-containing protein [Afifella marina]MBK5918461.1 hypothetical protein [Afifella marina]RAI19484.1 hypothetical protein CH311_11745 [Afifella marina DSM 2698]SCZ44168.1 regulator of CtrA degradation [Afifella marina DSM 2698]
MRRTGSREEPLSFGRAYAHSQTFSELFQAGMQLVEETAAYLDGDGRAAASELNRPASIVYATESMRLTTRLMQLASWLLLHRAVNEGEMTLDQAAEEKHKIRLDQALTAMRGPGWDELPEGFKALIDRSVSLQKRVQMIDAALFDDGRATLEEAPSPVASQLAALQDAFEKRVG